MTAPPPASAPPGLAVVTNTDLDVPEAFLTGYPAIRDLLKDERLLALFRRYDAHAVWHKRLFHRLGFWSLALGSLPLVMAAVRLVTGEQIFTRLEGLAFATDCCGVIAVVLVVWNRVARHRLRWCQAMFFRERLRHWHFQKFLDGQLIDLFFLNRPAYDTELTRRWGQLEQDLIDGRGTLATYVNAAAPASDFFHGRTPYAHDAHAKLVLEALWRLRVEHQMRFDGRKIDGEGDPGELGLQERTSLSETVATASLAGAVVVTAFSWLLSLAGPRISLLSGFAPAPVSAALAGVALLLAVISAATRAYRAGFTLPDEPESYEEYRGRLREVREAFQTVEALDDKRRQLEALEAAAIDELRRFVRMKMRATFLS
jgi:hypothetical protein